MAEVLNDAEFWLPSEFLPDGFFLEEKTQVAGVGELSFPSEFPYDYESNLSSPVESLTETESDEEEFMAGLSRQMAHSFLLHDDEKKASAFTGASQKQSSVACSPQSPLCAAGVWSKGPSQVSSPPSFLEPEIDNAWDLLYAAAGQMVRMTLNEEAEQQQKLVSGRGLLGPPRKPSPPPPSGPLKNTSNTGGYYPNPSLTQHQLQVNQFQHLKQQQLLKQQQCSAAWGRQNRPRGGGGVGAGNGRLGRPAGLSSTAWPPLQPHHHQQQAGSGMRAVFLGGTGSRRQSGGTGVFLPRRVGSPTELRKKPACSTVLLPARVVQALNLNLDDMGAEPRFPGGVGGFVLDHDAIMARNSAMLSQKRSLRPQPVAAVNHRQQHEIRLPPEWTY